MGRTVAKEARKIAAEITAATRQPVIRIKTAGAKAPAAGDCLEVWRRPVPACRGSVTHQ